MNIKLLFSHFLTSAFISHLRFTKPDCDSPETRRQHVEVFFVSKLRRYERIKEELSRFITLMSFCPRFLYEDEIH